MTRHNCIRLVRTWCQSISLRNQNYLLTVVNMQEWRDVWMMPSSCWFLDYRFFMMKCVGQGNDHFIFFGVGGESLETVVVQSLFQGMWLFSLKDRIKQKKILNNLFLFPDMSKKQFLNKTGGKLICYQYIFVNKKIFAKNIHIPHNPHPTRTSNGQSSSNKVLANVLHSSASARHWRWKYFCSSRWHINEIVSNPMNEWFAYFMSGELLNY